MSLVQIAFLSFRLAGYFTANAGGGEGNSYQAVHLIKGGRGLKYPVNRRHVLFTAESIFAA